MFDSTTFLVHKTRSGATLVSEFDSREAAMTKAIAKLRRYERKYRKDRELNAATIIAAVKVSLQLAEPDSADIQLKLPHGVSILITTRRLPPKLDKVQRALRRIFSDRQAIVDGGLYA